MGPPPPPQVHLQTQQEVKLRMTGMALQVVRSDGILALYNGLSASLCRQVPRGPPPGQGGVVGRTAGRARLPPRVPPAGLPRASLSPGSRAHAGGGEGWRVPSAVGALWTWSLLCLPS